MAFALRQHTFLEWFGPAIMLHDGYSNGVIRIAWLGYEQFLIATDQDEQHYMKMVPESDRVTLPGGRQVSGQIPPAIHETSVSVEALKIAIKMILVIDAGHFELEPIRRFNGDLKITYEDPVAAERGEKKMKTLTVPSVDTEKKAGGLSSDMF